MNPRDTHHSLEVDLDHVKRRRVIAMRLAQFQRQLIGERGLTRIARPEEGHVGLTLERECNLVGEGIYTSEPHISGVLLAPWRWGYRISDRKRMRSCSFLAGRCLNEGIG